MTGPLQARRAVLHLDTERTWRGGENQIRMLVSHPAAAAWEWHLAAPPDSEIVRRMDPQLGVLRVRMRGAQLVFAARAVAAYVRAHRIGILDCQSSRAHSLGLMVRFLVPSVRLVVHRRVDYPPSNSWWSRRKYLSPRVDRYVGVSEAVTRVLREFGVPPGRLTTVRDAVDPAPHTGLDRAAIRARLTAEWGVSRDTVIVGNVAYLTEQKGHDTLVRSLAVLHGAGAPFFCYVAGGGPLEPALRQLAASLGLGEHQLRWLGVRDDVPELLAATDIFALSSNDEGLGTSLLDAAHAGCALVATNVGGIPEVVINEETGLLAPPRDPGTFARQLERLIADPVLRATLATAARNHVEKNFSWTAMVEGNLRVYEQLLPTSR